MLQIMRETWSCRNNATSMMHVFADPINHVKSSTIVPNTIALPLKVPIVYGIDHYHAYIILIFSCLWCIRFIYLDKVN